MSEDATSQPSEQTNETSPATGEDTTHVQQMLADAVAQTTSGGDTNAGEGGTDNTNAEPDKGEADKLGDSGKRALTSERKARREAERQLNEFRARLQEYEDRDKTELQKAQEAARKYEQELTTARVSNARLMAAAIHNLPADLIDLLGDGADEEIDARAKLLAERLAAAAPAAAPAEEQPRPIPARTRPVESLTPGARPANEKPTDPNDLFREYIDARRRT